MSRYLLLLYLISVTTSSFSYYNLDPNVKDNSSSAPHRPEKEQRTRRLSNELSELPEFKDFNNYVDNFIERWDIRGASLAMTYKGKLVYAKGFGEANHETNEAVHPDHLFRVASVSKLITAVGIMKQVEDGILSLEEKVFGEYGILNDSIFLNFQDKRVADITVRHLLEHSGGWTTRYGDPMFMPSFIAEKMNVPLPVSRETVTQYVLSRYLNFTPGSRSSYSNLGFMILGLVIEKVSGQDYETYIQEAVLNPLGIYNMQLGQNLIEEKAADEVHYYDRPGATYRISCEGSGEYLPRTYGGTDLELLSSAGGWIASASQLMKLLVAIDGFDSKPDLLSEESITMLTENEAAKSPLGWRFTLENGEWWRTGTLAGTSALMVRQSDEISWAFIVNTSTYRGSRFPRNIRSMMRSAINRIDAWPQQDLFDIKFPKNVVPLQPDWFKERFVVRIASVN